MQQWELSVSISISISLYLVNKNLIKAHIKHSPLNRIVMDLVSNTVYVLHRSEVVQIGNYLQLIVGIFVAKIILNYARLFKINIISRNNLNDDKPNHFGR